MWAILLIVVAANAYSDYRNGPSTSVSSLGSYKEVSTCQGVAKQLSTQYRVTNHNVTVIARCVQVKDK